MVVGVVGELEDMRRRKNLSGRRVAVLCSILVQDRVCIAGDVLVGVDSNDGRGPDICVYNLVVEADTNALNDDVV